MSAIDFEAEKKKVKEAYDFWIENEINHDIEAAMSVISEDALFLLPGMEPVTGGENLRELGKSFVETLVGGTWDVGHIEMAASGDLAVNIPMWKPVRRTPEGDVESEGNALNVWKKFDGEWKCIYCAVTR